MDNSNGDVSQMWFHNVNFDEKIIGTSSINENILGIFCGIYNQQYDMGLFEYRTNPFNLENNDLTKQIPQGPVRFEAFKNFITVGKPQR